MGVSDSRQGCDPRSGRSLPILQRRVSVRFKEPLELRDRRQAQRPKPHTADMRLDVTVKALVAQTQRLSSLNLPQRQPQRATIRFHVISSANDRDAFAALMA